MANEKFPPDDETPSTEDFITHHSATEDELRSTIAYLIRHRALLRDAEIEVLEARSQALVRELADTNREITLEELRWFRDVMRLHKRLPGNNGEPRD